MRRQKNNNPAQLHYSIAERIIYSCLGVLYALGFVYVLFFTQNRWRPFPKRNVNWVLFGDKIQHWQTRAFHTRPENVELYKDILGNILLFLPFPFFLYYFFHMKTFSRLLLACVVCSFLVETTQYLLNIGVADVDDLVLNTIGSLLGLLILSVFGTFKKIHQYRLTDTWQTADEW